MKKLLATFMVGVVTFSSLAACNKQPTDNETSTVNNANKMHDIVVWTEKIFSEEANKAMDERVKAFGEKHNINVTHEQISALDFMTNLNAAVEAGNVPDIATAAPTKILSYYPNNPFEDITELVEEIHKERPFFDTVFEGNRIDGKFYFAPMSSSLSLAFIRKDKMEEKGISKTPETWDELFNLAEQLSDPQNNFYGLGMGCGPTDEDAENTVRMILWNHGASLLDKEGNFNAKSPEFKKVIEKYVELYQKKVIPPAATTWDSSGNNKSYLMEESAIVFNAPTLYSALKNDNPELFEKTVVIAPPAGSEKENILMGFPVGPAILKDSKNKETSEELIKFLMEKEWYDSYVKLVAPVLAPMFKDALENDFWKDGVNKEVVNYVSSASGYYGYPVKPIEGRSIAAKHYFTFPIANALNSILTGDVSVDDAIATLEKQLNELKDTIK